MTGAFEILGRDGKRLAVSDAGRLVAGPSQGAPGRVVIAGEPQPGLWLLEAADRGTAISIADEPVASGQRPLGLLASARDDGFELRLPDGERPLELPQDGRDGAPLRVGPEPAVFRIRESDAPPPAAPAFDAEGLGRVLETAHPGQLQLAAGMMRVMPAGLLRDAWLRVTDPSSTTRCSRSCGSGSPSCSSRSAATPSTSSASRRSGSAGASAGGPTGVRW